MYSDFTRYDVASGSEVSNVKAEKKAKRAGKQKGLSKGSNVFAFRDEMLAMSSEPNSSPVSI